MASSEDGSDTEYIHPRGVPHFPGHEKRSNVLPVWGNDKTMNLNPLILTNIQTSHYFKVNLFELKTYHEVVDEIYYKVQHLEPWEKGSRKTGGQTGMCGGVRGVGAGGIVSTAYCLLFKLFTLKLTRKQLIGLITHCDSPYLRGLGFMYIRYTQPPPDLWGWYEPYLEDEEEIDPKAGGGHLMTIGNVVRQLLTKLDWYDTLFPRIPVPIQMSIDSKLSQKFPIAAPPKAVEPPQRERERRREDSRSREREREREIRERQREREAERDRERERERRDRERERDRERDRDRDRDRERERDRERDRDRARDGERKKKRHRRNRSRSRSRDRGSSRNTERSRSRERRRREERR